MQNKPKPVAAVAPQRYVFNLTRVVWQNMYASPWIWEIYLLDYWSYNAAFESYLKYRLLLFMC